MQRVALLTVVLAVLAGMATFNPAEASHAIGIGVRYWETVDDLEFDFEDDRLSYQLIYQYRPAMLIWVEAGLEFFPSDFSGMTEDVYAPQVLVVVGSVVYAGVGIGAFFLDGEFAEDPFYVLRAGVDLELLPRLHLDISANYQTTDVDTFAEDLDTDTVTLGAALRMEL